jgi:hypothetical protein
MQWKEKIISREVNNNNVSKKRIWDNMLFALCPSKTWFQEKKIDNQITVVINL